MMKKRKRKRQTDVLTLKFDQREMVYQRVETRAPNGQSRGHFYICRHYGSRECWIDSKVLTPETRKEVLATPLIWREIEVDGGQIIKIVPVDWLLDQTTDPRVIAWLEGMSTVFDYDNSGGRLMGQQFYRNP